MSENPEPDSPSPPGGASSPERPASGGRGVRERLGHPRRRGIAWAAFYPDWYLATYPDARERIGGTAFDDVLRDYLDHGQSAGNSPNPFFDEAWYRATHPETVTAIADGRIESGFDHYCRTGYLDQAPHWLFDELEYRRRYPDLTDEVLAEQGAANGYGHYLRHGDREGRSGSTFFDPAVYAAANGDATALREAGGAFHAFLRQLDRNDGELRASVYFDPAWYLSTYPDISDAIAAGRWKNALHHYLTNRTASQFDPLPEFSEAIYLMLYPDVAAAVQQGHLRNGYQHFLAFGASELRNPCATINLRWYEATHETVRADLEAGLAPDAFTHYLTRGQEAGLPTAPPDELEADRAQDEPSALFRDRARTGLQAVAHSGLDFTCGASPDLAVIMQLRSGLPLAVQALAAVRDRFPGKIELILVDCSQEEETRDILRYARGAWLMRFDIPLSPQVARNAAIRAVSAPTVLMLDDDTDLGFGAIAVAQARLASDPRIGAVGARLVGPDGRILSAGGIVWREGGVMDYLRGAEATAPEASFTRTVDFCPSAFLLARAAVLQEMDGFDETFQHANLADADLGIRMTAAGYRTVYDPAVVVHQLAHARQPDADPGQAGAFFRKHKNHLRFRYLADPKVEVFARSIDADPKRVLFIEDLVPLRMIGSGFGRSNDLIRVMASMGVSVTVYPMNDRGFDLAAIYADMPDTVEVMHDRTLMDLDTFLAERQGYYDLIWVARTHNLDRIMTGLTRSTTGAGRPPRVVLDTEAISALREAARQRAFGEATDLDLEAAILKEFDNAHFCQNIAAVTEREADTLRSLGFTDAIVVGHIRDLTPTPRDFAGRSGLLFIGAMHEMASPNYDSLCWFADEVLPLIERELGWETRVSLVGYTGPDVSLDRFRDHPRITLRGSVGNTEPLYDSHRLFIAPTRYAAGTPYKVYEAASFGLPVVATELLRQQLGWEDGTELLVADGADPEGFARQVVRLYRDPVLWQTLRENALARLARENSREHYVQALTTILGR